MDKEEKDKEVVREEVDYEDLYLRKAAEMENFKKRKEKETEAKMMSVRRLAIGYILEIVDDLERIPQMDEGVEIIYKKTVRRLKDLGVSRMPQTEQFDPDLQECVVMVPGPRNTVMEVLTPGYMFKDEIIRHAQVAVGNGENNI